jgi:hypothetical protein
MGIFSMFKSKNNKDLDSIIIGFFRSETGKLLGLEPNTKAYDNACQAASDPISTLLIPMLDQQILLKVRDTLLRSVSSDRVEESTGAFMILLFTRFSVIQKEIVAGRVKLEDATPDIIANVLHNQLKSFIKQVR